MRRSQTFHPTDEAATRKVGAWLANQVKPGDVVFLDGKLGAGKTTLVRGLLEALDYQHAVRSPTFGLIQAFETCPPVMHCDLYRVKSYQGLGLEDYLSTHVCLIEWPDRAAGLIPDREAWHVRILFEGDGRLIRITKPSDIGA